MGEYTDKVVYKYGNELLNKYKMALQKKKATGNLLKSLSFRYKKTGSFGHTIEITAEKYLQYIESGVPAYGWKPRVWKNGTKYSGPPIKAIEAWVIVKRIKFNSKYGKKKPLTSSQMAFAIGKGMEKSGMKPFTIISEADKRTFTTKLMFDITAAIQKDINIMIQKALPQNKKGK
jgi:hypothetical protein